MRCRHLQTDQTKLLRHTVLRHHRARNPRCLLDIICRAGRYRIKNNLLRRTPGHILNQHRADLFLSIEIFLLLRHIHNIAKRTHRTRHDRDLLHRLGILLQCADQSMTNLVVGNDTAFFLAEHTVLLLLTDQNDFHCFKQILLRDGLAPLLNRKDRGLVDHICQIRTHRAGRRQSDCVQIDGLIHADVLRVYLQRLNTPLQIRLIHHNPAVKTSRTQKRLIQHLRTVRRRQHDQSLGWLKSIHLREQLVQRLLTLIISSAKAGITALRHRVDLIDENNTRRVLFRFVKQVTHTGRTNADEHLYKVRT